MSEVSSAGQVKRHRSRRSNFSDNEIAIMVDEVLANYKTLFSPVTSSNMRMKNNIWSSIAEKINVSTFTEGDRSGKEIRKKWNYYKCYVKKKALLNIRMKKSNGISTASTTALSHTEKKVLALIPVCQIETDGDIETELSDECSTLIDETGCSGADGPVSPNFPRDIPEPESSTPQFLPVLPIQPVKEESVLQNTVDFVSSREDVDIQKVDLLKQLLDVEKHRLSVERSRLAIEERRLELEEEKISLMRTSMTNRVLRDSSLN